MRIERLAELVYVNGGMSIRGWGVVRGGDLYGRIGLEDDEEAIQLSAFSGFVTCLKVVFPIDGEQCLIDEVRAIWDRKRGEHKSQDGR
jgi:hypothetical protein